MACRYWLGRVEVEGVGVRWIWFGGLVWGLCEEQFGYLYRVEGGAFSDLVTSDEEFKASVIWLALVLAYTTDEDIVFT